MYPVKFPRTTRREQIECRQTLVRCRWIALVAEPAQDVTIVIASETIAARHHGIDRGAHPVAILGNRELRCEGLSGTELFPPQSGIAGMTAG